MSVNELLRGSRLSWLAASGKESDVVLSSRIRLARNFREIPFPNRADFNQLAEVRLEAEKLLPGIAADLGQDFDLLDLERITPLQRDVLIEKQLISATSSRIRSTASSSSPRTARRASWSMRRTTCASSAWRRGSTSTRRLRALRISTTWSSRRSTSPLTRRWLPDLVPDESRTGLRASVLLHLPGLVFTRNIQSIMNISPQLGLAIRSVYGDETESVGNLFQISNQLTLGFSEAEIIENLKTAVMEIVSHERQARKALALYMKERLEDEVWRAYGTLRYARLLSEKEVLELLSKVRLGIDLKLINEVEAGCFSEILISSRTSYLQNLAENENLSKNEIDRLRAEHVRKALLSYARGQENQK